MWVENDGLHWQFNQLHGVASDPREAIVQALSFLQTASAEHTENNE